MTSRHPARTIAYLSLLYFVQGLPFGVQAKTLPIYLRTQGVSLTAIGLLGLLSAPWLFKVLWAPLVERFHHPRLGARRTWLLPMQLGLAIAAALAAFVDPSQSLGLLLALVFAMNLFAATMDVAVDGLAVDLLTPAELGLGNTAQVVGYKLGMLTSGGLLVWASGRIGWTGVFAGVALLAMVGFAASLVAKEPSRAHADAPTTLGAVYAALVHTVKQPGTSWVLACIVTYKLGESMADAMFKPFLVDAGFSASDIGLWVGTVGMAFSLAGSVAGGLLASRAGLVSAIVLTAGLRLVPMAGQIWLAATTVTAERALAVTCLEHAFGGALTTAMFAFMMSRVDRRIGATHYTALATIEVLGKMPAAWASGPIAERAGYATLFAVAATLSLGFLVLVVTARRRVGAPSITSR